MLESWYQRGDMPTSFLAKIPTGLRFGHTPSKEQVRQLAGVPPIWLFDCRPQTITVLGPQVTEIETLLRFGGRSIYFGGRSIYNDVYNAHAKAEMTQILTSTSWRITTPLRWVVISVREIVATSRTRWSQFRRRLHRKPHGDASERSTLTQAVRALARRSALPLKFSSILDHSCYFTYISSSSSSGQYFISTTPRRLTAGHADDGGGKCQLALPSSIRFAGLDDLRKSPT
jgi:hypothetical protein